MQPVYLQINPSPYYLYTRTVSKIPELLFATPHSGKQVKYFFFFCRQITIIS